MFNCELIQQKEGNQFIIRIVHNINRIIKEKAKIHIKSLFTLIVHDYNK